MTPLKLASAARRYQAMIGVGGIGSGMFFALNGNQTLGREESRSGRFLDRRDYCKLHIIAHYVQVLLGSQFVAIPIGRVGADQVGRQLLAEMAETGMDMRYVRVSPDDPTLFSFCFIYPDGSGGNLTTDDSACARLTADDVAEAEPEFARFRARGIALAAPEVPLAARRQLLELGSRYGLLRVASFAAQELPAALESGMLHQVDLLALNLSEAAALAGVSAESDDPGRLAAAAADRVCRLSPGLRLAVTAGRDGSWVWDGQELSYLPAMPVQAVSTAGAGDAYLAGLLVGLTGQLSLTQAQQLATLVAGLSVTSPHTIHKEIDRHTLRAFARQTQYPLCAEIQAMLEE